MKQLTILGSTGTIGKNTLDVVRRNADKFSVYALTANRNIEQLLAQAIEFKPSVLVLMDENRIDDLAEGVKNNHLDLEILVGLSGLQQVACASEVTMVMAGIVGAAGLLPTMAAAEAGKTVLLANKESLVMSGHLLMAAVKANQATLLPIDSEHNAIFQCLPNPQQGVDSPGVRRILLTASGGPFRETPVDQLVDITPKQACAHPNWVMGQKISVDSATMMNKGLEVIEAHWLFAASAEQVDVVVHPQSVIHSMVEYVDGSVLAQMGNPDMRTPIAHAMAWPDRMSSGVPFLDFLSIGALTFEAPNYARFPCLKMAYQALEAGKTAPAILNAANEIAVENFLREKIKFTEIAEMIEYCLSELELHEPENLEQILDDDRLAREKAGIWLRLRGVD